MFEGSLRTKSKSFIHSHTPVGATGLARLLTLERVKTRILKGYLSLTLLYAGFLERRGLKRWRSQDLVVVGALEEWGMGRGVPFLRRKSQGRGCATAAENFRIFSVRMTCFGAFLALF